MAGKKKRTAKKATKKRVAKKKKAAVRRRPAPKRRPAPRRRAARMAPAAQLFVIMLDRFVAMFPDQWPITARASTLAAISRVTQYDGGSPEVIPRKPGDVANFIERKSLLNSRTGQNDPGGIHELIV
jgi:hypothetical protein